MPRARSPSPGAASPSARSALDRFAAPTRDWFKSSLGEPTRAQLLAWPAIASHASTLVLAPTGSGKTLAAFLWAINELMFRARVEREAPKTRILYISPLKALAVDVEKNLRAPLAGILREAERTELAVHVPTVFVRTGDTPAGERAKSRRKPPEILITTPESLYLMLTSGARETLTDVETVILDEIHSIVPTKRGAHLALSLERLEEVRRAHARGQNREPRPLQRIGLSATQRPHEEAARLLAGFDDAHAPRPVTIVDGTTKKDFVLEVELPDIDLGRLGEIDPLASGPAAAGGARRSIWPHLHERLVELVRSHRSTMIFVNSRRLAERLAGALNDLAGEELALAHHGSVAREKRVQIEDRLKSGTLPAIVATSSMELGIDMGAVDLVVQVEAPPSIASGLQRVGRAGHQVGATSEGIMLPKHRADLVACAAAIGCMREGEVEETFYPRSPLDVLAQQIVAIAAIAPTTAEELYALARRAAPFADLPRSAFEGVLDLLSGRYPSDEFAELRPRIVWDRIGGAVRGRDGALRLAISNGGTIPDRGLYGVFIASGNETAKPKRVGELDEEMVFELREGEVFFLGASSWRVEEITLDKVVVVPAAGEPGKMPFWHGDRPGRSRAFGTAIGKLLREIAKSDDAEGAEKLKARGLSEHAARNAITYVREQVDATEEIPSDKTVVVERFFDEMGDHRVCVLTPFGSRVHAPWATAVQARLRAERGVEADVVWSDDGIAFRITATDTFPDVDLFIPKSDEVEGLVTGALGQTALFAARFRESAARALLLPRRHPTKRTPLWAQRKRASDLLLVASRYPSFPILLEAYRECLRDVFDLRGLVSLLQSIEARKIRVHDVMSDKPSPFATSILFSFAASFIYDGDAPLAERRAQALLIDHAQLRELLGEAELRELLDPDAIATLEDELQRRRPTLRGPDAIHDLLLSIGDLSEKEILSRVLPGLDGAAFLETLVTERRVYPGAIAGERRFVAAEDAARFRDALGVSVPRGLPSAFLERAADPWLDLVARYARTHGPFRAEDVAARFGVGVSSVLPVIERLVLSGRAVEGAFLRGGTGREFADAGVLRSLRGRSLARLRADVEPVPPEALAHFLVDWHGLQKARRGPDALLACIAQLEGCPLPASVLESEILPARLPTYRAGDLDALTSAGLVVWAGVSPLGANDGRIALYLAEHEPLLAPNATEKLEGGTAATIRELLERRGAVFFPDILRAVGGLPSDALGVLWDMVYAGEVTNDTLEPLRSLLRTRTRADAGRAHRARGHSLATRGLVRSLPPGSEGRWSLRTARWDGRPTETERRAALAQALLDRYGVVTRELAHAEGIAGGFSAVYEVYKAMEEAGRLRRGYFVEGHGGAQFALPGAEEKLRSFRDALSDAHADDVSAPPIQAVVLAATDPANPYGAALPWPADPEAPAETLTRPQRAAGAKVILFRGALVAYGARGLAAFRTYLPSEPPGRQEAGDALVTAIASLLRPPRKALLVTTLDGREAREHPLAPVFAAHGFRASSHGLLLRRAEGRFVSHPAERSETDEALEALEDEPHALGPLA